MPHHVHRLFEKYSHFTHNLYGSKLITVYFKIILLLLDALILPIFPLPQTLAEVCFWYQHKLLHCILFHNFCIFKSSSLQVSFIVTDKKKLHGARSGKYRGCCTFGILCLAKKCCSSWDSCASALLWRMCHFSDDHSSGHSWCTASWRHCSTYK